MSVTHCDTRPRKHASLLPKSLDTHSNETWFKKPVRENVPELELPTMLLQCERKKKQKMAMLKRVAALSFVEWQLEGMYSMIYPS